jgi:hypothetical protein
MSSSVFTAETSYPALPSQFAENTPVLSTNRKTRRSGDPGNRADKLPIDPLDHAIALDLTCQI